MLKLSKHYHSDIEAYSNLTNTSDKRLLIATTCAISFRLYLWSFGQRKNFVRVYELVIEVRPFQKRSSIKRII